MLAAASPGLAGRRVVFFLQGRRVPAARVRGMLVARALRAAGVRCEWRIPCPSVYGDMGWPWPAAAFWPFFRLAAVAVRLAQLRDLDRDDVVFFQRPMIEFPTVFLERIAARGRRAVLDFDDAIYLNFRGESKLRALVDLADQVIVGNHMLFDWVATPHKTTCIPTVVDTEYFRPLPPSPARGREVVIGWTGLSNNFRHLEVARRGLERALRRTGARLLLISDRRPPSELMALRSTYVRWQEAREVEDLAPIDIGLMPLLDTPYARGKCAYKLIQYMALARPAVASPVGINSEVLRHGVDGLQATSDAEWEEALVALIEDPDLRARMGDNARARVEAAYSLEAVTPRYLQVLERAAGSVCR